MPHRCHDKTLDPDTMSAEERRAEVASILARGLVRATRVRRGAPSPDGPPSDSASLAIPGELRLSVAPRPGG